MKRLPGLITATMMLLCALAYCQTINVTGTVVDSTTSAGINGATVKFVEYPAITTTTAANGTFTLTGTATILQSPRSITLSDARVTLSDNVLAISGFRASAPVTVDVYSCNGARLLHLKKPAGADGAVSFDNLWQARGLYYVKIGINGTERIITSLGITIKTKDALQKSTGLGKTAADYTLQVTKSGYITKNTTMTTLSGSAGTIRLAQEQEQTGVWVNVTPQGVDPSDIEPAANSYGMGSIVGDPARPSDMYVGGSASGLWKSSDYGKTWAKINSTIPNIARGTAIAVAGTTPATVWAAGYRSIYKSTNGGVSFTSSNLSVDLYSLTVDPYDNNHLISGLHEASGVYESTDGGITWRSAGSGTLGGGVSVYPFFINTGNAATTRTTWFAIGQNGSNPGRTTNSGANWSTPNGIGHLEHPHGNAQIFQNGSNLWVGGSNGASGQGVYRSTDYGVNWSRVDGGTRPEAVVWGSATRVYAMYAWACSQCDLGTNFESAPLPAGNSWTSISVVSQLNLGPNTVAVAFNGTHYVFVGCMWSKGLWRYVEP